MSTHDVAKPAPSHQCPAVSQVDPATLTDCQRLPDTPEDSFLRLESTEHEAVRAGLGPGIVKALTAVGRADAAVFKDMKLEEEVRVLVHRL